MSVHVNNCIILLIGSASCFFLFSKCVLEISPYPYIKNFLILFYECIGVSLEDSNKAPTDGYLSCFDWLQRLLLICHLHI